MSCTLEKTTTSFAPFILTSLEMISEQLRVNDLPKEVSEEIIKYVDTAVLVAVRWAYDELPEDEQACIDTTFLRGDLS